MLVLCSLLFRKPSAFSMYLKMQMVHMVPSPRLSSWIRSKLILKDVEDIISFLINVSFKTITTSLGGVAIDVDKFDDFETIKLRFNEWFDLQKQIVRDTGLTKK